MYNNNIEQLKPLVNASIYIVDNIDDAIRLSNTSRILFIGELNRTIPRNFIECSVLLPPFESVSAEVDGNLQVANDIYLNYLTMSEQCYGMFATIIVALYSGVNITLYIDKDDRMSYVNTLLGHFANMFGMQVGTFSINPITPFIYNPEYNHIIASILYSYMDGFINEMELLLNIPFERNTTLIYNIKNTPYVSAAIDKLAMISGAQFGNRFTEFIKWLTVYKQGLINYGYYVPGDMITMI